MKFFPFILFFLISCAGSRQGWDGISKRHQRALPPEVPEMVLVRGKKIVSKVSEPYHPEFSGYSFKVSKYEISNKDFCRFLNVDSISRDSLLIRKLVKLDTVNCKIIYHDKNFVPVMGFEDFPVLMVSWWGAKHYCRWLTKHTNDRLEQKGEWRELNYRLPEEYEWISAASDSNLISDSAVMCDSIGLYVNKTRLMGIRNIRSCGKNNLGIYGINDNAFEWIEDDFYPDKFLFTMTVSPMYPRGLSQESVIRKHCESYDSVLKNNCGREGRLKDGFYSDTGFRIVQTYLGKATGAEF